MSVAAPGGVERVRLAISISSILFFLDEAVLIPRPWAAWKAPLNHERRRDWMVKCAGPGHEGSGGHPTRDPERRTLCGKCLRLLLAFGAKQRENMHGVSEVDLAKAMERQDMVEILKRAGGADGAHRLAEEMFEGPHARKFCSDGLAAGITYGYSQVVAGLMRVRASDPNECDSRGNTPLMILAKGDTPNALACAKAFFDEQGLHVVDARMTDCKGRTASFIAKEHGNDELAELIDGAVMRQSLVARRAAKLAESSSELSELRIHNLRDAGG